MAILTYTTKDTGEALALRMAGIAEPRGCVAVYRGERSTPEWTFTFEDSPVRRLISNAFLAQGITRKPLDVSGETIAIVVSEFARLRKEHFQSAKDLPKRFLPQ